MQQVNFFSKSASSSYHLHLYLRTTLVKARYTCFLHLNASQVPGVFTTKRYTNPRLLLPTFTTVVYAKQLENPVPLLCHQ